MLPRPWQATVALAGDFLLSLLNAAQVKLGARRRLLIDVTAVAHEHMRPLPTGRTHQADRPSTGTAADESGERGKPREPARSAGGERHRQGTCPAADRCSAV